MYKNDMLLILVGLVLLYFILMWIYTVTKACVHPHQGPGPKPLEGNGKCFHKLLWALNQAQDKTRSLVKDKKKTERKDNRGGVSQCVCLGFSWFHGKLLGNEGFSVCRERGIGILVVVLHYIAYFARFSVEPWSRALSVSAGVHAAS